ncbi:MAG: amidohydrolase family protein [Candidatus Sulfotelmatobacter sp.]
MSNSKTIPPIRKPNNHGGWVRKHELDDYLDRHLPIPTQVVSNEEFIPLPQTAKQRAVENMLFDMGSRISKKLGIDRREFFRMTCGMAAGFAAMNCVFGHFFKVDAAELHDPAAARAMKTDYFIFDVQTHHVAAGRHFIGPANVFDTRRSAGQFNPVLKGKEPRQSDFELENYIKEVFLDSDTDVACLSGIPDITDAKMVIPPDEMVRTRNIVNELTRSQRMMSHGLFSPDLGTKNLENMHRQAETLKIDAWKGYTGQGLGADKDGWWMDDEKITYPALEYTRDKLKIRNICLHKGLAIGVFNEAHFHPKDMVKASKDFPELNFLLYHSGLKTVEDALPAAEDGFRKNPYVPWVSDLCDYRRKNSYMTNVYMELGTSFGTMVVTNPTLGAHVLGMIIQAFGADHVLWGTDSIWWGSPQWQIEALRRLEMPELLMKQFGYAPLTPDVKAKIFGLNAARLYGINPQAKGNPVPADYVDRLRKQYKEAGNPAPSNTQYGWVRA